MVVLIREADSHNNVYLEMLKNQLGRWIISAQYGP